MKTAGWFEFEYKQCSCGEAISKTGYKGKTQRLMSLTMPCKFFTCFAYKYALCFDNVYDDNQNGKDSLRSSPPQIIMLYLIVYNNQIKIV